MTRRPPFLIAANIQKATIMDARKPLSLEGFQYRQQTAVVSSAKAQIWILAALTLPYRERIEAFDDIAQMLGTDYCRVMSAATRLKSLRDGEARKRGREAAEKAHGGVSGPKATLCHPRRCDSLPETP